MKQVIDYIEENKNRYLNELIELLKIKSISADSAYRGEIKRGAEWVADRLKKIGFDHVEVKETKGCPAVYGDYLHAGSDKPTILFYGHYDVQPPDPLEKWTNPPFEPVVKDGAIYARGTADDKGQLYTHLCAFEALIKQTGTLPVNVKVFIEGEEEAGTGATDLFVEQNPDLLACDAITISDTSWNRPDLPTIVTSLRGLCYLEVKVKGPSRDLHSGVYGGKIQNPLNAMAKIIAKLQDENGVIQIPGYYDDVVKLTEQEREDFTRVNDDEYLKKEIGVKELWGEKGFSTEERNWARPSLDVHGVWGGYMGEGSKTVIASEGHFKISSRIVANQNPEKCCKMIKDYIEDICPQGVDVEVKVLHYGEPVMIPVDSPYLVAAQNAFESAFAKRPLLVREGASIPITAVFQKVLKAPSIMVGFGLNEDNIHSPDENFRLEHFYKGIKTCAYLYDEFSRVKA